MIHTRNPLVSRLCEAQTIVSPNQCDAFYVEPENSIHGGDAFIEEIQVLCLDLTMPRDSYLCICKERAVLLPLSEC